MLTDGSYLLSHVGFSREEEPVLIVQQNDTLQTINTFDFIGTLSFDLSARHCTGWHDITTGDNFICPDHEIIDAKYEQCSACQKRTGFNPAFYNATTVSEQQQQRNIEPHALYLAYFGSDVIKVGITHAKRGYRRLLEQGARSTLMLDTFPTALIARQYESQIARLSGIAETIQLRKKIELLPIEWNNTLAEQTLLETKRRIENDIKVQFNGEKIVHFYDRYFKTPPSSLVHVHNCTTEARISGVTIGTVGSLLLTAQDDNVFVLPLKKFTGYNMLVSQNQTLIDVPARQTSLF